MRANFGQPKIKTLDKKDPVHFKCVRCGDCCRKGDVELSAWDVQQISRHLGVSDREFLEKLCRPSAHTEIHIPFPRLRTKENLACPFLETEAKPTQCMIYQIRPTVCRAYPLAHGYTKNPSGVYGKEFFYFQPSAKCGKRTGTNTVSEWLSWSDEQIQCDQIMKKIVSRAASMPLAWFQANDNENVFRIYEILYFDYAGKTDFIRQFARRCELVMELLRT